VIPLPVIAALAAGVIAGAGAWTFQENRYEAILAERTAEYSTALAAANANALAKTIALQKAKDEAERKAQIRITAARRDAAASQSALVSLSDAADSALRHASTSHSACLADANTRTVVLGKCAGELQDMGEIADGWHNEALTLREAWPKKD
jgi:7-keto-8-aminopelargonate synthetase-like enzyme